MKENWENEIKKFLLENFSIKPNNIERYKRALTHSSHGDLNNQRLAFLGDSKINGIIREHYFMKYPDWERGLLTENCNKLEKDENLATYGSSLRITKYMKFGDTYKNRPEDLENITILGEALEALFGAIYLDQKLEKTKEAVRILKII